MKTIFALILCVSATAWAESVKDFNKALMQDVQKQINKDEESFKSRRATRGPASVEAEPAVVEEPSKIDKTVRQIGPNKW